MIHAMFVTISRGFKSGGWDDNGAGALNRDQQRVMQRGLGA